jgi:glutathione S-transferase
MLEAPVANKNDSKQPSQPIRLFVVGTGWGVPFSTSAPFPLKLETWLRMTGLDHEVIVENNPSKGPKKKWPWIEDGDLKLGDTELIIEHLKRTYRVDPDSHLSDGDRALSVAWHRTFEEHYHQAFEHALFIGRGGPARLTEFARTLPPIARSIVPRVFVSQLRKQLYARGLGRHSEEEIVAMGKTDLDAAATFLGDKPYFLGDEPSALDACVFGFLGVSVYVEGDNPLFNHAASLDNLHAYCERMRQRFFSDTLSTPDRAISA